jgi:hypothetical protein
VSSVAIGERFARAVAAQDADAVKDLLAPDVSFRALTPSRCWEGDDADSVVDEVILGTWFPPERAITRVLGIDHATVGGVDRVGYRFQATLPEGDRIIEQQAYLRVDGGRISWLRILCSGFVHGE